MCCGGQVTLCKYEVVTITINCEGDYLSTINLLLLHHPQCPRVLALDNDHPTTDHGLPWIEIFQVQGELLFTVMYVHLDDDLACFGYQLASPLQDSPSCLPFEFV